MNVSLTTEMEQWVQQKVGSGLYSSASEVVRKSLRALYASENQKSRGAQRVSPVCCVLLL
jgi:antitoxin ParD1/3/4